MPAASIFGRRERRRGARRSCTPPFQVHVEPGRAVGIPLATPVPERANMTPAAGVLIGVDVGGTTMSGGLVAADGAVLSVVETSPQRDGPGTALDTLLGTVGELLLRAEARGASAHPGCVLRTGRGLPARGSRRS